MTKKKTKSSDVIKKKEDHSFTKKYSVNELAEKENEFSKACADKVKKENLIEKLKGEIKDEQHKLKRLASDIEDGGEDAYEECDVEIIISEMKKNYYYEGELVDSEEADDSDLQLEIEE